MRTKVILLLLLVLNFSGLSAQSISIGGEQSAVVVNEIRSFITAHRTPSASSSRVLTLDAQNLEALTTKVQPSVYVNDGAVNTYGESPKNLFTDVNSLPLLETAVALKNNIEIMVVKVKNAAELNAKIDLASLVDFKKLKYVYVVSSVNATSQDIAKMIMNNNEKYSIFYKIEKGDANQ